MNVILRNILRGAIAVGLVGCGAIQQKVASVVSSDLSVAIARGEKALGPNDPLVVCYKALDKVVKAQLEADQLDNGLLLDMAMRARIIDMTRKSVAKELQGACAEISIEIMTQAASRGIVR